MNVGACWDDALDALEARLAREEVAVAGQSVDGTFQALPLPAVPMSDDQRVRAQVALQRIARLEASMRVLRDDRDRRPAPTRVSPYS